MWESRVIAAELYVQLFLLVAKTLLNNPKYMNCTLGFWPKQVDIYAIIIESHTTRSSVL